MAIAIPSDIAFFLNCCGVAYPDINEDEVRAFAGHVRVFASNVEHTHRSATSAINDMSAAYSGYSYEQLVANWATVSATHMAELDGACKVLATTLDVAASVIAAVKVATLAELAALAASFVVVLATPGLGLTSPVIAAAARKLCDNMAQSLVAYVAAEVLGKAIEPLEHVVSRMVNRVVYGALSHALAASPPPGSALLPLHIEPDVVLHYAEVLDHHADDLMRHVTTFADDVAGLDFTTPGQITGIDGSNRPDAPILPTGLPLMNLHPEVLRTAGHLSDPLPASIGPQSRVVLSGPGSASPMAAQTPGGRWYTDDPGTADAPPVHVPVRGEIGPGGASEATAGPARGARPGVYAAGPAVRPGEFGGMSVAPGTPEVQVPPSIAAIDTDGGPLFSSPTTPWARSAQAREQLAAAPQGIGRPSASRPARRPSRVSTPWSKTERPTAVAKVFAPAKSRPAPRGEQDAAETNRDGDTLGDSNAGNAGPPAAGRSSSGATATPPP